MEKLTEDVGRLQKQVSEIRLEMDEFCGTISEKLGKFLNLYDQVKEHVDDQIKLIQSTFSQLLDKLVAKFESHVDVVMAFKSQTVKHQVDSKSVCINLQKETQKLKKQL